MVTAHVVPIPDIGVGYQKPDANDETRLRTDGTVLVFENEALKDIV